MYKYRLTLPTEQVDNLPDYLKLVYNQNGEYILFAEDSMSLYKLFAALKNISSVLDPSDPECKGVLKVG